MHEAWLVARREYLERIRSKAFRISTVLIPMIFAVIFGIAYLSGKVSSGAKHLVVASNDPALAENVGAELLGVAGAEDHGRRHRSSQLRVDVMAPVTEDQTTALNVEVDSKRIDGYLWLDAKPGVIQPRATYVSRGSADFVGRANMGDAIGHALVREELMKRGATSEDIEQSLKDVDLKTLQVKDGRAAPSDASKSFWGAYVMTFMLYFAVVFYGVNVAQSVVAEKTSRVFEVLLSSVKPESLMMGKLLGVGAVGLTQMGLWIGLFLLLNASSLAMGSLGELGVTPLRLIFFLLYFLLGFFFYSAFSAGLGATVSQESELQQFNMIIVLPQVIGLVLTVYILSNPGAWPVVLLSLFPPCTPIVMCLRMAAMAVPAWQLALSLLLMVLSIYAMVWVASRIYRVGILMYGKRPTLPEMLRWIKYS